MAYEGRVLHVTPHRMHRWRELPYLLPPQWRPRRQGSSRRQRPPRLIPPSPRLASWSSSLPSGRCANTRTGLREVADKTTKLWRRSGSRRLDSQDTFDLPTPSSPTPGLSSPAEALCRRRMQQTIPRGSSDRFGGQSAGECSQCLSPPNTCKDNVGILFWRQVTMSSTSSSYWHMQTGVKCGVLIWDNERCYKYMLSRSRYNSSNVSANNSIAIFRTNIW